MMNHPQEDRHDPANVPRTNSPHEEASEETGQRFVLSRDLLQGQQELLIQHEGEVYRLRVTKNNKLILHK